LAIAPIITFPTTTAGFSTNAENITLKGIADLSTKQIQVNNSLAGVAYASGTTTWTFVTMLTEGDNIFNVVSIDFSNRASVPDTITVTYTPDADLNLEVSSPTSIILERSKNSVKISVIKNPEPNILGYNFYGSEEVGGGVNGFTLLNTNGLVTDSDFFKENNVLLSETQEVSGNIRKTYIVEDVRKNYYYSYIHNRVDQPLGLNPLSEPNHYVVTALAFDSANSVMVESPYSAELGDKPLLIDTSVTDLPARTTLDVQESLIDEILKSHSEADVKPGTVTRDIHINPPSDEFERLYIIQDFQHRSQSFLTLLAFDDSNNDGISDDVLTSPLKLKLKEALLLTDDQADQVQTVIDNAFTKLAGNVNVHRNEAQKAIGQALFYTRTTPTSDANIAAGSTIETLSDETTASVQFITTTSFTLPISNLSDYYNSATDRYEILLDIQALKEGSAGNVDATKINVIVSGVDNVFAVTNPNPTEFGQDIETNEKLAERAILAFASVDAGTEAGYLANTLGTPNVARGKIISAGEPLMQRDIDPLRKIHVYGKVDIYIEGAVQEQYQDTFGFLYATVKQEQALIQSASHFQFRLTNPNITIDKPIFDVIQVKNVSKSANYDTIGYIISGDGNVIDLDSTLAANIFIGLSPSDVIQIAYRYRDSDPYIFANQSVDSITAVVGETAGTLSVNNYQLQHLEDPLKFGRSTAAKDQMQLLYYNGVPNGVLIHITDESWIMTGENEISLTKYGVDNTSVVVTNQAHTVTYIKDIDYIMSAGSEAVKTTIKRTASSHISNGSTVYISYACGENFIVTYAVNSLLNNVQERVNTMKHLTADVVVKSAVQTYIDFDMTVVLEEGVDQGTVDRKIRTEIAKFLASKQLGESVYQSDIIDIIESVTGVYYVVVPFSKMVKANGSLVLRESLNTSWTLYQIDISNSYKSTAKLNWETSAGGGPTTEFRGVFENDLELEIVDSANAVAQGSNRAYIAADGHVILSTTNDKLTSNYTVTYLVENAAGARDINCSDIEQALVGSLVISYAFKKKFSGF